MSSTMLGFPAIFGSLSVALRVTALSIAILAGCGGSDGDPCADDPCENGGACSPSGETFACTCPPDFTGETCASAIDDCADAPCLHGGTCTDGVAAFTCACATGYTGATCEAEIDDCLTISCGTHGACVDLLDGFVCACDTGHVGALCELCAEGYLEIEGVCVPTCEAPGFVDCSGHGACDDADGTATCACDETHDGMFCEVCATGLQDHDTDGTCTPTCATAAPTCTEHAVCDDTGGTATCVCIPGYVGEGCDTCAEGYRTYGDACVRTCAHPEVRCDAHATCDDESGPATCACVDGYVRDGTTCMLTPPPVTSGIVARYDALATETLTSDDDGRVVGWEDVGGQGHDLTSHALAPRLVAEGIGGHPALDFGEGDACMIATLPLPSELSVFVVVRMGSPEFYGAFVHHGDRDFDWSFEQNGPTFGLVHFQSENDRDGVQLYLTPGTSYVLVGSIGAVRRFIAVSSTETQSTSGGGSSIVAGDKTLYVGTSDVGEGSRAVIGEIIYYDRVLGDEERDAVVEYLRTRWDI